MAPPAAVESEPVRSNITSTKPSAPLKSSGLLDQFEPEEVTSVIGTEFPSSVKLEDWINSANADELIRELAIKVSERGVVMFRQQDGLTNDAQKYLMQRMGELTGKPANCGMHVHPVWNALNGYGSEDPEISIISSVRDRELREIYKSKAAKMSQSTIHWHTDCSFEPNPPEYTSLRLTELPKTGGDTLWASGYELYDRISKPYQRFLESLTATSQQKEYNNIPAKIGFQLYDKDRGSPENSGYDFEHVHPVVRTNPVTGWKSVFAVGFHVGHINDVTDSESKALLDWFLKLINENNNLQVRFKWKNKNDIAIWDNRCVLHTATFDTQGQGDRYGIRAVAAGEKPYLDVNSLSRKEALDAAA